MQHIQASTEVSLKSKSLDDANGGTTMYLLYQYNHCGYLYIFRIDYQILPDLPRPPTVNQKYEIEAKGMCQNRQSRSTNILPG